jgi:uncharacterized membrane protein
MAALTIWLFEQDRVADVLTSVARFKANGWIDYFDAGLVQWAPGDDRPTMTHLPQLAGDHAFPPSFWTTLFGVVFFPAALGAGLPTAGASVNDDALGITPQLAASLRAEVKPGGAALLVYSSGAFAATGDAAEQIRQSRVGVPLRMLTSNLGDDENARIHSVFGD